jgi:hypothetical protein
MHYKLLATTLLAASVLGAPAIAYAQSDTVQKGQSASNAGNFEAKTPTKHHKMRHAHMKPGTTTGLSSKPGGKSTSRKSPAS